MQSVMVIHSMVAAMTPFGAATGWHPVSCHRWAVAFARLDDEFRLPWPEFSVAQSHGSRPPGWRRRTWQRSTTQAPGDASGPTTSPRSDPRRPNQNHSTDSFHHDFGSGLVSDAVLDELVADTVMWQAPGVAQSSRYR